VSETISFRVPDGTKEKLMAKAHRSNHTDLTSYLRGIVLYAADADDEVNVACAPSTHEVDLRNDNGCPLLRFVATERCNACPYREHQPAVSREQLSLDPSPSGEDEISKTIGDLFKEDEGKT
jgi:hypothetical protein